MFTREADIWLIYGEKVEPSKYLTIRPCMYIHTRFPLSKLRKKSSRTCQVMVSPTVSWLHGNEWVWSSVHGVILIDTLTNNPNNVIWPVTSHNSVLSLNEIVTVLDKDLRLWVFTKLSTGRWSCLFGNVIFSCFVNRITSFTSVILNISYAVSGG